MGHEPTLITEDNLMEHFSRPMPMTVRRCGRHKSRHNELHVPTVSKRFRMDDVELRRMVDTQ